MTTRRKKTISIVGPGNLGRVLAIALYDSGYRISEIITRDDVASLRKARSLAKRIGASGTRVNDAKLDADVIWLCVTDAAVAGVANQLSKFPVEWKGKVVLHASGALGSSELTSLKKKGALIGSLHPMNTFVAASKPDLAGTPFAAEGEPDAVKVATEIAKKINGGAEVFTIKPEAKILYHALGSFSSPLLVAMLNVAERIAAKAGIKKPQALMRQILRQTLDNFLRNGSAAAFSGPIKRGDVETVRKHVSALRKIPHAKEIYVALSSNAVDNLPIKNGKALRKALRHR
jgi:predicted short-subunit dehydrogenase-like oxidoreductase (DUF2520 family)